MKIKNSMNPQYLKVNQKDRLWDMINAILGSTQDSTPVVDDAGHLVGMVSIHDVFERLMPSYIAMDEKLMEVMHECYFEERFPKIEHLTAGELMHPEVDKAHPEDDVIRAVALLVQHRRRSLPVVDEKGMLLGMISRKSILERLKIKIQQNEVGNA